MKSERKQHPVLGEFVTFKSTMSLAEAIYATKYSNKAAKMDNFDDVRDKIDLISKQTLKRMRVHVVEKDATSFVSGMHNVIRTVKGKYRPVISFGDTSATTSGGKSPSKLPPSSDGQYLLDLERLAANSKNRQITNPTNASNSNANSNIAPSTPRRYSENRSSTTNASNSNANRNMAPSTPRRDSDNRSSTTNPSNRNKVNMEINASNSNVTNNTIVSSTSMFEDTKAKAMKYLNYFIGICQLYCELHVSSKKPLKHPSIPSRAWLEDTLGALRNAKTILENNQPIDSSSNSGKLLNNIMSRSLGEIFTEKYRELDDRKKAVMNIVTYNTLQDQYKNGTSGDSRSARSKRRQPAMQGGNGDRKKSRLEDLFPNGSGAPAYYNRGLKINSDLKHDFKDSKEIGNDNLVTLYEDRVYPVDEPTFVRNILLEDGIDPNDFDIRYNNNNTELKIKSYTEDTGMSRNVKEAFMLDKYVKCTTLPSLFDPSTSGRKISKDNPLISFNTFESKPIEFSPLIPNPLKPTGTIPLRKLYEFFYPADEDEENTLSRIDQVRDVIYKDILTYKIKGVSDDGDYETIYNYIKSNKTLLKKIQDILDKYYKFREELQKKHPTETPVKDPQYNVWFEYLKKKELWNELVRLGSENKELNELNFTRLIRNKRQEIGYKNPNNLLDLKNSINYFIDKNESFDEVKYMKGFRALMHLYRQSENEAGFIVYALNDKYTDDNYTEGKWSEYVQDQDECIILLTKLATKIETRDKEIRKNKKKKTPSFPSPEQNGYSKQELEDSLNNAKSINRIDDIEHSSILEIAGYIKYIHEEVFDPALHRLNTINTNVLNLFNDEPNIKKNVELLLKLCSEKVNKYTQINRDLYKFRYKEFTDFHESNTLWNDLLDLHQDAYYLINVMYEYMIKKNNPNYTNKIQILQQDVITFNEVIESELYKSYNEIVRQQNQWKTNLYEKDFEIMNAICDNFYPDLIKFESQKIDDDDDGNMVFTCLLNGKNGKRVNIPAGLFSKETVNFLFQTVQAKSFKIDYNVNANRNEATNRAKEQVFKTYLFGDRKENLKKLIRLKTLGDHMQLYYVKYLNLKDKPIFITTNDRILFGSALFTRTPCMFHTMSPQGWLPTLKYIKSLELRGLYKKHVDTKEELINKFKDALCKRHIADIFGEINTRTSSNNEDDEESKYMHLGVFYNPTQERLQDGEDWTTNAMNASPSTTPNNPMTNVTMTNVTMTNATNASPSANSNYRNANTISNSNKGKAPLIENSKVSTKRKRELNASTQNKQTKTVREWGIFLMKPPQRRIINKETVKITVEKDGKKINDYIGLYELKKNGKKKCWYPVITSKSILKKDETSYLNTLDVKNPDCIDENYIVKFTTDYGVPSNSEIFKYETEIYNYIMLNKQQ